MHKLPRANGVLHYYFANYTTAAEQKGQLAAILV